MACGACLRAFFFKGLRLQVVSVDGLGVWGFGSLGFRVCVSPWT